VDSVDNDVFASSALAPVWEDLFAKKLCEFHANLEANGPSSGKTISSLLKESAIRSKSKKNGSGILKKKSLKSKIKKSVVPQKRCSWLLDEYLIFLSWASGVFVDRAEFLLFVFCGYPCVGCVSWCVRVVVEFRTSEFSTLCSY
jgi:hypothetical protein